MCVCVLGERCAWFEGKTAPKGGLLHPPALWRSRPLCVSIPPIGINGDQQTCAILFEGTPPKMANQYSFWPPLQNFQHLLVLGNQKWHDPDLHPPSSQVSCILLEFPKRFIPPPGLDSLLPYRTRALTRARQCELPVGLPRGVPQLHLRRLQRGPPWGMAILLTVALIGGGKNSRFGAVESTLTSAFCWGVRIRGGSRNVRKIRTTVQQPCDVFFPGSTRQRYGFNHGFKVVRTDFCLRAECQKGVFFWNQSSPNEWSTSFLCFRCNPPPKKKKQMYPQKRQTQKLAGGNYMERTNNFLVPDWGCFLKLSAKDLRD